MSSKKKKNVHHTEYCACDLYDLTGHCCKRQCFHVGSASSITKALNKALQLYGATYLAEIIVQFLPLAIEMTEHSRSPYLCVLHKPVSDLQQARGTPCPVWAKHNKHIVKKERAKEIRCVMYGDGAVGKSTLTQRFITGSFVEEYDPTIEDVNRKQTTVGGMLVVVWDIIDPCGEDFGLTPMRDAWIRMGDIFLVCFAINDRGSFESVELHMERILRIKEETRKDWAMILVATKCDLDDERKVTSAEAAELAQSWNVPYIETSSKEGENVEFLFENAVYALWISSVGM